VRVVPALRHVEHVMGTVVSFDVRTAGDGDEEHAGSRIARACTVLHVDDRTFSLWRDDSEISRIHRGEQSLWDSSDEVAAAVARSLEVSALSGAGSIRGRASGASTRPASSTAGRRCARWTCSGTSA
jgi:thiamine biosynthesis lipoprotein ApbE